MKRITTSRARKMVDKICRDRAYSTIENGKLITHYEPSFRRCAAKEIAWLSAVSSAVGVPSGAMIGAISDIFAEYERAITA